MGFADDPAKGRYVMVVPDFARYPAHSEKYLGEPYVRARLERVDGGEDVQDAKVTRWTRTHVLVHWETFEGAFNVWVTPDRVTRIKRSESSWQYPYDDSDNYPGE